MRAPGLKTEIDGGRVMVRSKLLGPDAPPLPSAAAAAAPNLDRCPVTPRAAIARDSAVTALPIDAGVDDGGALSASAEPSSANKRPFCAHQRAIAGSSRGLGASWASDLAILTASPTMTSMCCARERSTFARPSSFANPRPRALRTERGRGECLACLRGLVLILLQSWANAQPRFSFKYSRAVGRIGSNGRYDDDVCLLPLECVCCRNQG